MREALPYYENLLVPNTIAFASETKAVLSEGLTRMQAVAAPGR